MAAEPDLEAQGAFLQPFTTKLCFITVFAFVADSEALLTGANGAASGTAAGKPKGTFSKMCACLSAEYYQHVRKLSLLGFVHPATSHHRECLQLFDVDAAEVGQRMLSTLIPWKPALESSVRERPDLYSPLWIMCTLGFSLAAAYNFGNWTASDGTTVSINLFFLFWNFRSLALPCSWLPSPRHNPRFVWEVLL